MVVARLAREKEIIGCSTMEKIVHEELMDNPAIYERRGPHITPSQLDYVLD
jgi:hypothetical protein